jgi:acyl carrier protein
MADPEWVADGKLTPKGVDELKTRLPYADLSKFGANPSIDKIGDLYTVEMLVQYVQSKLAA